MTNTSFEGSYREIVDQIDDYVSAIRHELRDQPFRRRRRLTRQVRERLEQTLENSAPLTRAQAAVIISRFGAPSVVAAISRAAATTPRPEYVVQIEIDALT